MNRTATTLGREWACTIWKILGHITEALPAGKSPATRYLGI